MTATTADPDRPSATSPSSPAPGPDSGRRTAGEERRLPFWFLLVTGAVALVLAIVLVGVIGGNGIVGVIVTGYLLHLAITALCSRVLEGPRWVKDRTATLLVVGAFAIAIIPLVTLVWEVVSKGWSRYADQGLGFLTQTMNGVYGGMAAGGIGHAIVGTLEITLWASIISVPIGLLTSIYLVEYGRGRLAAAITFFVDVMTGIPSIVAGLFSYGMFLTIITVGYQYDIGVIKAVFPDGITSRVGLMGAVALSVLMIPTVVRSSEEMLRLVPNELREAAYALGVPKWLTIVKVVLRTAVAGLATSVTLAIARVIGETAPLLVTIGMVTGINLNMLSGRMASLPTFIMTQYTNGTAVCNSDTMTNPATGESVQCLTTVNYDRAWAAALALIVIVMLLNLVARLVSHFFAPKAR